MGDGFVRPGVNGNFHHKKDYHDFDRKICRAKNATGCKFPGNWVQDNNYCHIVTGSGVQKVYDDFDVLFNRRGSLISEAIFTLVSPSNKCMKLLKVSKSGKQIILSSHTPKNQWQKNVKIFVGFGGYDKTRLFAFEIY